MSADVEVRERLGRARGRTAQCDAPRGHDAGEPGDPEDRDRRPPRWEPSDAARAWLCVGFGGTHVDQSGDAVGASQELL
jgi:hypothetical protein